MPAIREIKPINPTTFEVELLGKDKVEIGDRGAIDFKPHIKLNRWDGECFIKVGLPTTEKVPPVIKADKVKFKGKDIEADFYPLEPTTVIAKDKDGRDHKFTQNELGGFEFEVILKKKPKTNRIVLDIKTQGLEFLYQPPMTEGDKKNGHIQPDNIAGSYAVYHATRTNMHASKADAEKYKCGKMGHFYYPYLTDADGRRVRAEGFNISDGLMTVTLPQDFLDSAAYPVSIDPDFGYTDKGGSSSTIWVLIGFRETAPADGTVTSISMYLLEVGGQCDVNFGYYNNNVSEEVGTHVAHGTAATPAASYDDWYLIDVSGSITNGNVYWLIGQATTDAYYRAYTDYESGFRYATDTIFVFDNWDDSPTIDTYTNNWRVSIYCTYEEAGVTHYGAATLSGVGTLAGLPHATYAAKSTLAGVGTLAAIGCRIRTGLATLTGAGTLSALGVSLLAAKATLSGVGSLSAIGKGIFCGVSTLAGTGTLVVSAIKTAIGKATLSGAGSLAAIGTIVTAGMVYGAATLSGIGSLAAKGVRTLKGAATLSGTGSLAVAWERIRTGAATLAGVGTLIAKAGRIRTGAATLAGSGILAVLGHLTSVNKATLAGVGSLTAKGVGIFIGAATLAGTGTLTAKVSLKRVYQLIKMLIQTRSKARMTVQTMSKARMQIELRGGGEE